MLLWQLIWSGFSRIGKGKAKGLPGLQAFLKLSILRIKSALCAVNSFRLPSWQPY